MWVDANILKEVSERLTQEEQPNSLPWEVVSYLILILLLLLSKAWEISSSHIIPILSSVEISSLWLWKEIESPGWQGKVLVYCLLPLASELSLAKVISLSVLSLPFINFRELQDL